MTIDAKTGKKKIVPKIERVFNDSSAEVNPHLNPFTQLIEHNNNLSQNNN